MAKSAITVTQTTELNAIGRSYYCFCLEQALANIKQARALVSGDKTEMSHELPKIERLIADALQVS
jgi:hypothetical protein